MTRVMVAGIGLLGPGMSGWAGARAVLRGEAAFQPTDLIIPPAASLPATPIQG